MKVNYSFSHDIGPAQKLLWNTGILFILEIPIGIHYKTPIIVLEGLFMILFPFVAPFSRDITFFLTQYNLTLLANVILLVLYKNTMYNVVLHRLFHMFIMSLYINTKKINPLTPFTISREITYAKIVWPQ